LALVVQPGWTHRSFFGEPPSPLRQKLLQCPTAPENPEPAGWLVVVVGWWMKGCVGWLGPALLSFSTTTTGWDGSNILIQPLGTINCIIITGGSGSVCGCV
jgi:hypothetical protein